MIGSRLVMSPFQGRQVFSFYPFLRHQHDRRAAMLLLLQQAPHWVIHVRQRIKIFMPPLPTHELRPDDPSHLFCIANDILTDVVQQLYLLRPRDPSRPLGVQLRGLHPRRMALLGSGGLRIGGGGGMGARPHRRGGVCGWHREHTFCSPVDFLGDWCRGRRNIWHCLDGPSQEWEILLLGMRDMVSRVPAPRVAHPFDVERGEVLAGRLYWQHREIDARKDCLAGDDTHCSRVPEEAPLPINVCIVIIHGV